MHHQPHGTAYIGPSSTTNVSTAASHSTNNNTTPTLAASSIQPPPYHSSSQQAAQQQQQHVALQGAGPPQSQTIQQHQHQQQQPQPQPQQAHVPQAPHVVSIESPLPPVVQRSLGDRSTEKRKNAALEIEALIKSLIEANNLGMIQSVITVLSKDFCTSMNSNYRKGGLVGLAATAIGLHSHSRGFLNVLLPPVLHCFDDPESRVRYYACESLYNIAKVARQAVLDRYFSHIWEGLTKLYADVDVDVKNGANLLDRLMKDIVTEADNFRIDQFLPLLQNYIRRTNPYIRQLIVGWITYLDGIPDISMLDYLPDFLDGLFNMLSDSNREIRQAADSALAEFLSELAVSTVVEVGPVVSILVAQCQSKERLNRLTASTWLAEIIHHPYSGGDAILPFHSQILGAILFCISDPEEEIRVVAERTNNVMLAMVRKTLVTFELPSLLETLTRELLGAGDDVPTKMACLRWINMLMEKRKYDMNAFTDPLLNVLLRTLSDRSDSVVLLDLQALSRISASRKKYNAVLHGQRFAGNDEEAFDHDDEDDDDEDDDDEDEEEREAQMVLNAILDLFARDRLLLETRGSLIIRKLCVLLNAKSVYMRMADTLSSYGDPRAPDQPPEASAITFISTMVQTLSIILLTASELHELRSTLASSFQEESEEGRKVFVTLFHCWCHNPVSTLALCLLARAYDLSFALVKRFSEMTDVTVGFLMQIDKLVQLLESPIFIHLRLQLLDVESPHHAALLKSIYGLLMCLPQGDAFRLLNARLTTVCNLRDNLLGMHNNTSQMELVTGIMGTSGTTSSSSPPFHHPSLHNTTTSNNHHAHANSSNSNTPNSHNSNNSHNLDDSDVSIVGKTGLSLERLLERFDDVMVQHDDAKVRGQRMELMDRPRPDQPGGGGSSVGPLMILTPPDGSSATHTNNSSSNMDVPDDETMPTAASMSPRSSTGGGGGRRSHYPYAGTGSHPTSIPPSLSSSSSTTAALSLVARGGGGGLPLPNHGSTLGSTPSRSPKQQQQQPPSPSQRRVSSVTSPGRTGPVAPSLQQQQPPALSSSSSSMGVYSDGKNPRIRLTKMGQ